MKTNEVRFEGKYPRGTKFRVMKEGCSVMITTFEGLGAAGVLEHRSSHKLKVGDIVTWDHQAYLGSDPGPGTPWFSVEGIGRGSFYPSGWVGIPEGILEEVK